MFTSNTSAIDLAVKTIVEDRGALEQASHVCVNGRWMAVAFDGPETLTFRQDGFDADAEKIFHFGTDMKDLCTAFLYAWLDYAAGKYAVAIPGLQLYRTWESLEADPTGMVAWAGILTTGIPLPEEWAKRIVLNPRMGKGVFELTYQMGKLVQGKEQKNSIWVAGENERFGGPLQQRRTFNKHVALNMLLNGLAINVHYFPGTAEKWTNKVMALINQPAEVRQTAHDKAVGGYIIKTTVKRITEYADHQAEKGIEFKSAVPFLTLGDGTKMTREELLSEPHSFVAMIGINPVGVFDLAPVSADVEKFLSEYGSMRFQYYLKA